MKKLYESPVVTLNEELAEGVYMASGDDCYTVKARIHQKPETGRGDYRIQVDGKHAATDNHHAGSQTLVMSFNLPVEYVGSNGKLKSGDGSTKIKVDYSYHNNAHDNIGLGDLIVKADAGLAITHVKLIDNGHDCGQH